MMVLPGEVCAVAVPVNVATAIPAVTSISAAFRFIVNASLLPRHRAQRAPQGFALLFDAGSTTAGGRGGLSLCDIITYNSPSLEFLHPSRSLPQSEKRT